MGWVVNKNLKEVREGAAYKSGEEGVRQKEQIVQRLRCASKTRTLQARLEHMKDSMDREREPKGKQ